MVFLTLANNVTADLDSAVTLLTAELFADTAEDLVNLFDLEIDDAEFLATLTE